MKRFNGKTRWLAATVLAGGLTAASADVDPSHYNSIVERNPFGLKPPPPPPDPASLVPPPPPVQLATVELKGITSILSSKRALLEIIPGPGKPMIKPILAEGEKMDSVEVVIIDVDKSQVVIRNGTLVTNLTFSVAKSSGPTLPPGGVMPGMVPPAFQGTVPQPAVNYGHAPAGRSGSIMAGGAPAYQPPAPGGVNPLTQPGLSGQAVNPAAAGFRSIPSRNIRSGGLPQVPTPNAPMSPEAAVIDLERNRQLNPPHFPPLPPTPLTPHLTPQLPPLPGQ